MLRMNLLGSLEHGWVRALHDAFCHFVLHAGRGYGTKQVIGRRSD